MPTSLCEDSPEMPGRAPGAHMFEVPVQTEGGVQTPFTPFHSETPRGPGPAPEEEGGVQARPGL